MSADTAAPAFSEEVSIALSPDGRTVVYVGVDDAGARELYVRPLDRFGATPIPGTAGALAPFFSPNGSDVAFAAEGELRRVSLMGGLPTTVCAMPGSFRGGSWSGDGTIVFGVAESGLWQVSARGGSAEPLTSFGPDEVVHAEPDFHSGESLLFFTAGGAAGDRLAVVDLDTGQQTDLGEGYQPRMTEDGHLLYLRDGAVWAAPFDAEAVRLRQAGVPVVDGVGRFAVASDGDTLAYVAAGENMRLVWVDRTGQTTPLEFEPSAYRVPRLSPDGREVAVEGEFGRGIWVLNLERGSRTRLIDDPNAYYPLWTPDGRHVTFALVGSGIGGVYRQVADSSRPPELLLDGLQAAGSWSPDGSLAYWDYPPATVLTGTRGPAGAMGDRDIGVMFPDGQLTALTDTSSNERSPRLSPDGGSLVYVSDESGRDEIYLQAHPSGARRTAISTSGGIEPVWSHDGRELFFRTLDDDALMVVRVQHEPTLSVTAPERLFDGAFLRTAPLIGIANYDVAPDGQRFLMVESSRRSLEVSVILSWRDELRRSVPLN